MPANPLGGALYNNVSSVVDRSNQSAAGSERVVDYKRNVVLLGNSCDLFEIWNVEPRVAHRFEVDRFGVFIDEFFEFFSSIVGSEFCGYAKSRKLNLELVPCSAVEVRRRN
jgi:hypothetical protein